METEDGEVIIGLLFVIFTSITTGFVLSRNSQAMTIKMHSKDLPEHALSIVRPCDP
jgi:hypothetical protein